MDSAPEVAVPPAKPDPGPTPVSISRAVGLGVGSLRRIPKVWGFGLAIEGFSSMTQAGLAGLTLATLAQVALAAVIDGGPAGGSGPIGNGRGALMSLVGTGVALAALGAALRVVYLAAAVPTVAASLKDPEVPLPPFVSTASRGLARATSASIWLFLIELGSRLLFWLSFGSAVVCVARAFSRGRWVTASILEASAASVIMVAMMLLPSIFGRVYLIRAIRADASPLVSAWDSGRQIFSRSVGRLGAYLGLLLLGWLCLAVAGTLAQGPRMMGSVLGPGHAGWQVAFVWLGSLLAGLAEATVQLGILGAFCAVDLDCGGELPTPPAPQPPAIVPAEVVLVAQEILTANAIPDPDPSPPLALIALDS